jgi:hypothetical protein
MSIKRTWICDGCGVEESSIGADSGPTVKQVHVGIHRTLTPTQDPCNRDVFYDLCGACRRRLLSESDPYNWSRKSSASQRYAAANAK